MMTRAEKEDANATEEQSCKGVEDDNSSNCEESTVKVSQDTWAENMSQNDVSSTDYHSSSSSEHLPCSQEITSRCDNFKWIRGNHKSVEPSTMNFQLHSKPPINRLSNQEKNQRKERSYSSLDTKKCKHSREDRNKKSMSTCCPQRYARSKEFQPCQNWCCAYPQETVFDRNISKSSGGLNSQGYGSSSTLLDYSFNEKKVFHNSHGEPIRRNYDACPSSKCCSFHFLSHTPEQFVYEEPCFQRLPMPYMTKYSSYDEKIIKMQTEKDNLQLQVQILAEQIDAQSNKISDLEKELQDKKQLLLDTDTKLQREVLSRSSLETQKLELMSTVSELKFRQVALEKENIDLKQIRAKNAEAIKTLKSSQVSHQRSKSYTDDNIINSQPPPNREHVDFYYGSLPRQQYLNANPSGIRENNTSNQTRNGSGDAKEKLLHTYKTKCLKGILCRIKRSNSGNIEDFPRVSEFQRGGIRATVSTTLNSTEPQLFSFPSETPFAEWELERICAWFQNLGLEQYISSAKKWVRNGKQLREATSAELEKGLNIKNPLHLKKLSLALIDAEENGSSDPLLSRAGKLDTVWVLRWLNDVGLPQYKETFFINRIDGRVLHRLTMDDLTLLHVTSMLHVVSIKRGIQVLRENDYRPDRLQRRSIPNDSPVLTPQQISLWTSDRVLEWLKAMDLAEYTPNLRGAGVHGGLLVYENKFTAELLASLLSIPPGKTLLRRHLNIQFKELLGEEIIHEKRKTETVAGLTPLTPTLKLKLPKKSQFSLKRKKPKDVNEYGNLICPLDPDNYSDEDRKSRSMGCLSSH